MANTKVTGDLIASGTITAANLVSGTLDTLLNSYLTTNTYATQGYVTTAVNNLIDAAPASLDTLNELAAALNDDANFATTVTNSLATKLNLSGGTMTGALITTSPLTIQDSTPYIQWKNASGTRLGYIQHNETDLVMSADTGDIILDGNVEINGTATVGTYAAPHYSQSGMAYQVIKATSGSDSQRAMLEVHSGAGGTKGIFQAVGVNNTVYAGTLTNSGLIVGNDVVSMVFNTAGNVGIGTTSPGAKLEVNGTFKSAGIQDSADSLAIFINGNEEVGIGTTSPTQKLDVAGTIRSNAYEGKVKINSTAANGKQYEFISIDTGNFGLYDGTAYRLWINGNGNIGVRSTNPSSEISSNATVLQIDDSNVASLALNHSSSGKYEVAVTGLGLDIRKDGSNKMLINTSGNVGIGTTSPSAKLEVVGGINVDANGIGNTVHVWDDNASGQQGFIVTNTGSQATSTHTLYLKNYNSGINASVFGQPIASKSIVASADGGEGLLFGTISNKPIYIGTNDVERIRISESGKIGIGTTSPQSKLHVEGDISQTSNSKTIVFSKTLSDNVGTDIAGFTGFTGDPSAATILVTVVVNASSGYAVETHRYLWNLRKATAGRSRSVTTLTGADQGSVNSGVVSIVSVTPVALYNSYERFRLSVNLSGISTCVVYVKMEALGENIRGLNPM